MTELDKFKRRTIRSVARLLLKEKKSPEELWQEMKKETGTDCRVLWERMRALCIKKLNHMIAEDDRSANLPVIARLSLTDWLLVDLVLVHEEIDVIAMDKDEGKEYPALIELFNLVQRFDIEGRCGEALAEAWAAGTVYYNRQGRQCSPMLLQRRWYQLKKLTRYRFYKFWFSYRGNPRLLEEAMKAKSIPTRLQMAIAKRYPQMITKEFPDWEDLIEKRFVIMPEEFEAKMRMPNLPKPCSSNAPDLVLVEPVIETIDLRVESDPEDHDDDDTEDNSDPEKSNDATAVTAPNEIDITTHITEEQTAIDNEEVVTKVTEPIEEDGLSNVQLISATHVPEIEILDESPDESPEAESPKLDGSESKIEDLKKEKHSPNGHLENAPDDNDDDMIEIPSIIPAVNVDLEEPNVNTAQTVTAKVSPNSVTCETLNDSDEVIDDIIKVNADEFGRKAEEIPAEKDNAIDDLIKDKVDTFLKKPIEDISFRDNNRDDSNINVINNKEIAAIDLMADLNFVDDGIEFVDDGVEFVEEDTTQKIESSDNTRYHEQEDAEENKFDLKLLMYPVVYTTKLDHMKTFTNKLFTNVENKEELEVALIESKPISSQSLSMKIKQEPETNIAEDTPEYLENNQEITDDDDIEEDERVSPNSYILKKPKTRTYDLIKLCKNPDFNTKLKRLTIGFLSSTRNRQLLNACIPMTIDLSKAFESKLVNRTLYLKSSGTSPIKVKQEVTDKQASSIVPTAMPAQSLINNANVEIKNLISNQSPSEPMVTERTKVINLPDIDKIRRINQQLLTAQVPPLRVYSGNPPREKPPPANPNERQVIDDHTHEVNPDVSSTASTIPSIQPIEPVLKPPGLNTPLVKVKIEGDKSTNTIDTDTSTPPESLPPAKEKLLKLINQAKITTQEALAKIDDTIQIDDFPMPIVVNEVKANIPQEVPRKYGYQPRVKLAWAPKYTKPSNKFDNVGLLTSDTLNKMLHLLISGNQDGTGCKCCFTKKKAQKKKKKRGEREARESVVDSYTKKEDSISESTQKDKDVSKNPSSIQVPPENEVQKTKEKKVKTRVVESGRLVKYCCWAREKICNRKRITRHQCIPNECKCCCAEELVLKILEDEEKKRKELEMKVNKDAAIVLSDDEEESLRKACESIENVVQQSRDVTNSNTGHINTAPVVPNIVIRPIRSSSNVGSPSTSPVKVSVAVGVTQTEPQSDTLSTSPKAPFIQTIRATPVASLMPKQPPIPRIKHVVPRPQVGLPCCSCIKPAASQDFRCKIVIDASASKCARHPTPVAPTIPVAPTTPIAPKTLVANLKPIAPKSQEKVLYLHSKSIAKSPSESPIFLGKNKILLTTVKFPRQNDNVPAPEVLQAPKIIPTLPLPAGVQLVLLPSGNVSVTLEPGVQLDEAQLANLPHILTAVQEQLNASGQVITSGAASEPQITTTADIELVTTPQLEMSVPENADLPPTGETINIPETLDNITETAEPSPVSLKTTEVFQDTELPPKTTNVLDMEVDAQNTNADTSSLLETATSVPVTAPLTEDNQVSIDPEVPKDNTEPPTQSVDKATQDKCTKKMTGGGEEPDDDGTNNRKSLLSDLMEMSGISAEDTVAPETIAPVTPVTRLQNMADVNLPELSPVTSFSELKYACEQNGKFFKLDFETGVIVPINVCIKRNRKNKLITTKECIDLTDDADSSDINISTMHDTQTASTQETQPTGPIEYLYKGQTLSVSAVKPVKLFKAFRPRPRVLRVRRPLATEIDSPINPNKQSHIEKRKQNLSNAKIEAKIDLVDSDAEPMEEEYLLDSSDDDSINNSMQIEALDPFTQSDDSSDDEPLAKKSKRLKDVEEKEIKEPTIFDELSDTPKVSDSNESFSGKDLGVNNTAQGKVLLNPTLPPPPLAIDVVPSVSVTLRSNSPKIVEQSDALTVTNELEMFPADVSDEESDRAQPEISFMSDPSDGEGTEDCILGV